MPRFSSQKGSVLIPALLLVAGIIGSGFTLEFIIPQISSPPPGQTQINSETTPEPSDKSKILGKSTTAWKPYLYQQFVIKCLGADEKYSYVTRKICDATRKYWTQMLGSFPTDPEEEIQCSGADGKYSFVSRKACENTSNFWEEHPKTTSSSSSSSSSTSDSPSPPQDASADLGSLVLSGSPTGFSFSGATYDYTGVTVLSSVDRITVTAVTQTPSATITVQGSPVPSGLPSNPINLTNGVEQTIWVTVTEPGKSSKTYTIRVTKNTAAQTTPTFNPAAGAIAWGTNVTITSGAADHIYYTSDGTDPTTGSTEYTVPITVSSPTTLKALAVRTGYDNSAIGSASYTQAAVADLTNIALSGSPTNYTYAPATYLYEGVGVLSGVTNIRVTPTAPGIESITVNGQSVPSGTQSNAINLTPGVESTITVAVTESGKSSKTYTIKVTREQEVSADLTNITLSGSPTNYTYAPATYLYEGVGVLNAVASIKVTPTGAGDLTVDGSPVASGSFISVALTAGVEKTILVTTTEADKTTKTYTIKVTRSL